MTNKAMGNAFERAFCQTLHDEGFWAYNCPMHQAGQPADIIAMKRNRIILADCKVCTKQGFSLLRVEENQRRAMTAFEARCHGEALFVFKLADDSVWLYPWCGIECLENQGVRFMTDQFIRDHGIPLWKWLEECDD